MAEPGKGDDPVLAAQAATACEDLNRRVQTSLDLGRAIRFQLGTRALGSWNLIMAILGGAILAAIIVVNVFF